MALPTEYQNFIALSRYSRYRSDLSRRETWEESVDRWSDFWQQRLQGKVSASAVTDIADAIKATDVMPSMRTLMTAGPALSRDLCAAYNCSYLPVKGIGEEVKLWDSRLADLGFDEPISINVRFPLAFDIIMYILLCGTGVGFSVERQYVNTLPTVGKKLSRSIYKPTQKNFPKVPKEEIAHFNKKTNTIEVPDSKYGWASALRILLVELYNGNFNIGWDLSKIRPAGAPLKTFGGRASGPEPLDKVFRFAVETLQKANGRKLTSVECHDLVCKVADSVVVGGVRRAALISLTNLSDDRMRKAKSGDWWVTDPQRALANNSAVYTERPDAGAFMREWQALYESKSGERGIFNREAARKLCERIGRDPNHDWGTNPCSEIILRPNEFCNLSSIMVRPDDTLETLLAKAEKASIVGTWQASLVDFAYLPPEWRQNCEEEALLGVSMTGLLDHPVLNHVNDEAKQWLNAIRDRIRDVNIDWAKQLGINPAAAYSAIKPEGTVSQLTDTASGLHPRYSKYYIRRVRADQKDPLAKIMQAQGFPCEPDTMQPSNLVFSFPVEAPDHAVFRDDRTAVEQLEYWLMIQREYCTHKPSVTIYVKEHEWVSVGAWVYEHFDEVSGISFLPHSDHCYQQAPYEEIDKETFETMKAQMPEQIDIDRLAELETSDMTNGVQELACTGGSCEIV